MKVPVQPPDEKRIISEFFLEDNDKAFSLLSDVGPTDSKDRYLHWERVQYLEPPEGLTSERWWAGMKISRKGLYKVLPFLDKREKPFRFAVPDCVLKELHWIDKNAGGTLSTDNPITNPHTRDTYLISSLIDEAISSSQIEGASTTRNVAKDMLRQGRRPVGKSEQMIHNNYLAMRFIRENRDDPLTPAMIFELHRILTSETLEDHDSAGKFRDQDDDIHVVDSQGSVILHTPPSAKELKWRMERLCEFANETDGKVFIHPVIRAILLHFMLAYDHPFVDGNGRTARALFYWSMASQGYWIMEYISISRIIKKALAQYGKAYLHTETDFNDTTYFIIHQLDVIRKAIEQLKTYLDTKVREIEETEKMLEGSRRLQGQLNHRQLTVLKHALKHPNAVYKIQAHQQFHGVTYQTARTDLLKMADDLGLLQKKKAGRGFVFISPGDLQERIKKAKG